jgi:2-succinyl-6-hydroxy-2,4-cyclohexadiene-1-carboxylate synthase
MPVVQHDRVKLVYELTGPEAGIPLVLIHGLGDRRELWSGIVPSLSTEQRVLTYDLRGHGESDVPADPAAYSMSIFVADLQALLDGLGIARARLAGFSLGGAVAVHFALAHPERTVALAMINANAAARDPGEEAAMERAAAGGKPAKALMPDQERRWVDRLLERLPEGARLAAAVGRAASIVDRAASLQMPVWLVASDRDPGFARRSAALLPLLPRGRRVVIEGAGHAVMLDQPAALVDVLREFARDTA